MMHDTVIHVEEEWWENGSITTQIYSSIIYFMTIRKETKDFLKTWAT